jgi:hypothetical protein
MIPRQSTAPDARARLLLWLIMSVMLVGLPLAGVWLAGRQIRPYLEFPPLTRYVAQAPFSWWAFTLFAAINLLAAGFIAGLLIQARRRSGRAAPGVRGRLPWWGWAGVALLLGGWLLAWTRFDWFAPFQDNTFLLHWAGYIIVVNGVCTRRSGSSLMTDAPARFAGLILVSAVFWWFFEYLNRFVQNWYYVGVEDLGPLTYTASASLAFATVLPGILSTYRLLGTFALFQEGLKENLPLHVPRPRAMAALVLLAAGAGLALIGLFPDHLFALLWISPLLVITSLQTLAGHPTIFTPLRHGDWRPIVASALAALICGFLWELWNIGSMARWHYAIPFVERFAVFAMPVLGYGGYLPFGLICLAVGIPVMGRAALLDTAFKAPARPPRPRSRHTSHAGVVWRRR